ncbi:MAG: hypothetical protein WCQ69_07830 [Bacteroidales bacterium]
MSTVRNYVEYCRGLIASHKEAYEYLASRSLPATVVDEWGIGYNPDSKRIVLPICLPDGTPVATTERATKPYGPKYLHSKGFPTSHILFGLQRNVGPVAAIVEGPMDALHLSRFTVDGNPLCVLAVQGSTLSIWQAAIVAGLFRGGHVLIYPDHDAIDKGWAWSRVLLKMGVHATMPGIAYPLYAPKDADPAWLAENDPMHLEVTLTSMLDRNRNKGGRYAQSHKDRILGELRAVSRCEV